MIERPVAPQRLSRKDWFVPVVFAGSLMLHAVALALLFWTPRAEAARPPLETPIEVVQLPPQPEKPKPPPQKKPSSPQAKQEEPPQRQAQDKPAPKPPEPKPPQPKPPEPKRTAAAKPPPKQAQTERAAKPSSAPEKSVAQRMAQLIGPMPAMAMPALTSGDNAGDDTISYQQLILSRVAKQKREDRHDGIPTHAVIAFAIGDQGEVITCEVREKSLDPTLDAEAVAMVYRGAPYPPPPPGAPRRFSFGLAFHTL